MVLFLDLSAGEKPVGAILRIPAPGIKC